jgi:hypothetical protein
MNEKEDALNLELGNSNLINNKVFEDAECLTINEVAILLNEKNELETDEEKLM